MTASIMLDGIVDDARGPVWTAPDGRRKSGARSANSRPNRANPRPKASSAETSGGKSGHVVPAPWQTIEVRHLAALTAVADEKSFRRAAERLGYVQSAISGQIAHLERAAGTRLVERASGLHTVELTDAGRVLLTHAKEIIARFETAYADVSSLASRAADVVRIAGLDRFAPRRLARIMRSFHERHPLARVTLDDVTDELRFERLMTGKLDLVITELPLASGPYAHVVLEEDPYVLLVRAGSEMANCSQPPSDSEIASLRLMIPSSCPVSPEFDAWIERLGVEGRSWLVPESVSMTQVLVGAGLGEAIVPLSQLEPDPKTAAIELSQVPARTIVLAFHAERECSRAVYGFMRAVSVASQAEAVSTSGAHAALVRSDDYKTAPAAAA